MRGWNGIRCYQNTIITQQVNDITNSFNRGAILSSNFDVFVYSRSYLCQNRTTYAFNSIRAPIGLISVSRQAWCGAALSPANDLISVFIRYSFRFDLERIRTIWARFNLVFKPISSWCLSSRHGRMYSKCSPVSLNCPRLVPDQYPTLSW